MEAKNKKAQAEYVSLLNSGLFFEFYPNLTGEFDKDKDKWYDIHSELEKLRKKLS